MNTDRSESRPCDRSPAAFSSDPAPQLNARQRTGDLRHRAVARVVLRIVNVCYRMRNVGKKMADGLTDPNIVAVETT